MNVGELISLLQELDQTLPVYISTHYDQGWDEVKPSDVCVTAPGKLWKESPDCVVIA